MERSKKSTKFIWKIASAMAIERVTQKLHFDFFVRGKIPPKKGDLAKQE